MAKDEKSCNGKCSSSWYYYADVNIGYNIKSKEETKESEYSDTYKDACKNTIRIQKKSLHSDRANLDYYKSYVHSFSSYLGGINYKGVNQTGFKDITWHHTNVTVYYWKHDEGNVLPLLIQLTYGYWRRKDYYKRYKNSVITAKWSKFNLPSYDSGLALELMNISRTFEHVIVLKLDATHEYHANGEYRSSLSISAAIRVKRKEEGIYTKWTHKPGGVYIDKFRVLSTRFADKDLPLDKHQLDTQFDYAYVYFSSGNETLKKPIILELSQKNPHKSFYYELVDERWVLNPGVSPGTLFSTLDTTTNAHIIELSHEELSMHPYECPALGCHVKIKADFTYAKDAKYIKRDHSLENNEEFSVSSFLVKGVVQKSLKCSGKIKHVSVFWYPAYCGDTSPLLIHFSFGGKNYWHRRLTPYDYDWVHVSDEEMPDGDPSSDNFSMESKEKVRDLLEKSYRPLLTIDFTKNYGVLVDEHSTYKCEDDGTQDVINIDMRSYTCSLKFTHSRRGGPFKLKGIKGAANLDSELKKVKSRSLDSVSAFYRYHNKDSLNIPIVVELEREMCGYRYIYFYIQEEKWVTKESSRRLTEADLKKLVPEICQEVCFTNGKGFFLDGPKPPTEKQKVTAS